MSGSGILEEGEIRLLFERMVGPRLPSRRRAYWRHWAVEERLPPALQSMPTDERTMRRTH